MPGSQIQNEKFARPDESAALAQAYVSEHIVGLMAAISKGQPFQVEDHLGFYKDNWVILVGYPLVQPFSQERGAQIMQRVVEAFHPEYVWWIGPEVLQSYAGHCTGRKSDEYLQLDLEQLNVKSSLLRFVRKVAGFLQVERGKAFTREHQALTAEFLRQHKMAADVEELYRAMPEYVSGSAGACVLSARDQEGVLNAFFVLELAAKNFDAYLLGCYSHQNYIPHASDLLFWEMINLGQERGKKTINLGLGVNAGIRRFKEKWGGVPCLRYEYAEYFFGRSKALSAIETFLDGWQ